MDTKNLVNTNFDLEQNILRCWSVTTDIGELIDDVRSGTLTAERAFDILDSYAVVYENRFERMWQLYESVCQSLHQLRKEAEKPTLDPLFDTVAETPQNKGKKNSKKG